MPLNCPINLIPFFAPDACIGCRYHWGDKCYYYGARDAIPLSEVLTLSERVTLLECLFLELKEELSVKA